MSIGPAGDETLKPDDAIEILEEILPARIKSYNFGLKLKLPLDEVKAIHAKHQSAEDHLRDVIEIFLNGVGSEPTWRAIVDALRSPAVNLLQLAKQVETAHLPDTTATTTCDMVVPLIASTASDQQATSLPSHQHPGKLLERETATDSTSSTHDVVVPETTECTTVTTSSSDDEVKSKPISQLTSSFGYDRADVEALKLEIKGFHRWFNCVKESTIKCLMKCQIAVMTVVYMLTTILSVDEHKEFLKKQHKVLRKCDDHWELFGELNLYWNPFTCDLLDELIEELVEKNEEFESIASEMAAYKEHMQEFRKCTALKLFCLAVPHTNDKPPPGYRKMVTKHNWPDTITLEDVEEFRKGFINTFNLKQWAMIVYRICTGSFEVTWFVLIPDFVIEIMKNSTAKIAVFQHNNVYMVIINGDCVFEAPSLSHHSPPFLPDATASSETDTSTFEITSDWRNLFSPFARPRETDTKKFPHLTRVSMATVGVSKLSQLTVQCHDKKKAPHAMSTGSATTDHEFAYFASRGSNSVYSYEWNTEQWNKLPSCPYRNCALVIIDGVLTTVGGRDSTGYTNKLFTLRQRHWVEEYPPMLTARSYSAAVSAYGGDYIIVIGGCGDGGTLTSTVELFQVKTRRWYKLTNIPQPLELASATICGNQLHVIPMEDYDGYTCSIESLPTSDEPITSQSILHPISWTSIPHLPVKESTAATLNGQLVIIGGNELQGLLLSSAAANSIHQLINGQWVEIGTMSHKRSECLVVSPSPDRIMIVGGWGKQENEPQPQMQDSVEECVVL